MKYELDQEFPINGSVGKITQCYEDGTYRVFISGVNHSVIYTEEQLDEFKQIARQRLSELLQLFQRNRKL